MKNAVLGLTVGALFSTLCASGSSLACDGYEPPMNPYLADSPWPMSHRNPYCQASSPLPGPEAGGTRLATEFKCAGMAPITLCYSNPYHDGRRVIWGSSITAIFKADPTDACLNVLRCVPKSLSRDPISGAYTLIDRDNNFYVPKNTTIEMYTDAIPGDPSSSILLKGSYSIPQGCLRNPDEHIVGLNLTYDGYLVWVTSHGAVGVVSRDFSKGFYHLLAEDESVSNSIAVDEDHGIYIVTSRFMHRLQWTGAGISNCPADGAWRASYETGPDVPLPGRLGTGSGTTPTLMGSGCMDKFVVIADGRELMHLVLFWRDEIPQDWQAIGSGIDRRIAAQIPITFGNASKRKSTTEQSVLVRGYGAAVVSNDYGRLPQTDSLPGFLGKMNITLTNLWPYAPYGVEKFVWDPCTREMYSAWANPSISCPNGIPTMSSASGLMYCWGQRNSIWTLEALDWKTGESVFHKYLGLMQWFNSAYAATEIGADQCIVSGTLFGIARVRIR